MAIQLRSEVGLLLVLFCGSLAAYGATGPRCTVRSDGVPVYIQMNASSKLVKRLSKGTSVVNDFTVDSSKGKWCGVTEAGATELTGYVRCGAIECEPIRDASAPASPEARKQRGRRR